MCILFSEAGVRRDQAQEVKFLAPHAVEVRHIKTVNEFAVFQFLYNILYASYRINIHR